MHHQRIAWLGTFDKERARFWIGALAAPHTRRIRTACVDGGGNDVVARLDPKDRLMGAGKGVVELFGFETIGFGETSNGQCKNEE